MHTGASPTEPCASPRRPLRLTRSPRSPPSLASDPARLFAPERSARGGQRQRSARRRQFVARPARPAHAHRPSAPPRRQRRRRRRTPRAVGAGGAAGRSRPSFAATGARVLRGGRWTTRVAARGRRIEIVPPPSPRRRGRARQPEHRAVAPPPRRRRTRDGGASRRAEPRGSRAPRRACASCSASSTRSRARSASISAPGSREPFGRRARVRGLVGSADGGFMATR